MESMAADFYEAEVIMPGWELTDPLGRGAIRKARWEYTQVKRERDALKNENLALYREREKAVDRLIEALRHEQSVTAELKRRLAVCDEARKNLGEKINQLVEERDSLAKELSFEKELYKSLYKDHADLEESHEKLVRSLTDGMIEEDAE